MKLSIHFTPLGVKQQAIAGKPVLVIDVLRATTTIIAALANGAKAVVPTETAEEALRVAQNFDRDDAVLAGERGSLRIDGFALGNSPEEMTAATVQGKTIVMTTTNGTAALTAVETGQPVMLGAVTNYSSVAVRARQELERHGELIILCAGREKMFSLEDAYLAGRISGRIVRKYGRRKMELNDAASAALELARGYGDKWRKVIDVSAAARNLTALGFERDIEAATQVDLHTIVPIYAGRMVTADST